MATRAIPNPFYAAVETLRTRCMGVGLPTWRASSAGHLTERPDMPGPGGAWLRSRIVGELMGTVAAAWGTKRDERIVEPFPGCWIVPLPDDAQNQRGAITLAMALGPGAFGSEIFERAAVDAGLDPARVRVSLRDLAINSPESVRQLREMLAMMLGDLTRVSEHSDAVTSLTTQLTDSYETIDALYSIGRSMSDLNHPEAFVRTVCDRVRASLSFGVIAARFTGDPGVVAGLRNRIVTAGATDLTGPELTRAADAVLGTLPAERRCFILEDVPGLVTARYVQAVAQPLIRDGRVVGAVLAARKTGMDPLVSSYDTQLLEAAGGYLNAFLENAALYVEQHDLFLGTLRALTSSIDAKDRYTRGHSERVADLSARIGRALGMDDAASERVRIAGLVHDVGKIGVPEAVLCKSGKLNEAEFDAIKKHPEIGHRILRDIVPLADVLPGVLHHHERFDGRGYPYGLRGEQIPLVARIIALADTFDAMSSTRSYRAAMPRTRVLQELRNGAGTQFDPALVPVFLTLDLAPYDHQAARHADGERLAA